MKDTPAAPTVLRWTGLVTTPHDRTQDTVVQCADAAGRTFELRLTEDLSEALGGMLIDPPGPDDLV
ncbi:hypothetical protein ABZ404_37145 [Streptomyces sp. NPDC005878]|uniref:hypothetical protein n=1 Tax=Streptomyces sp. NPDC005878 TaxID=3157077 RepID=UPI0033E5D543